MDNLTMDSPVPEASTTEAELAAHIDQELGLPSAPKAEEPAQPDVQPDETPDTGENPETPDEGAAPEPDQTVPASEETPETPEEEPAEEAPAPEPATPTDEELSIEIEDAEGVTHKISQIEDLPEDFAPKNNRQIIEIVSQLAKLDGQREQAAIAAEERAQQEAITQTRNEQFASWDAEIAELGKQKRVDIADSERLDSVFAYMNEVNSARIKAGNPNLVTSFEDALDKFEVKEAKDSAAAAKQSDNERAKAKASLIGRSSAAANSEPYVYRAGSARSIDDIPVSI